MYRQFSLFVMSNKTPSDQDSSSTSPPAPKPVSRAVKTGGAMLGGVIEACALQPLDVTKVCVNFSSFFSDVTDTIAARRKRDLSFHSGHWDDQE